MAAGDTAGLAAPGAEPLFPPRLYGERAASGAEVMTRAVSRASVGIDPGLVVWHAGPDRLNAAVVLAPERPLGEAAGVVLAVACALADALGALAPPEVSVHFDWPGGLRVNGALAGELRAEAATDDPAAEPDWLVVAFAVDFLPTAEPRGGDETTGLYAEGCGEITPVGLLESATRHMLVWLNRFEEEGFAPIHRDWTARAWRLGEALPGGGTFLGLDEHGGRLVREGATTRLDPLTSILGGGA
ncbi:MAG: DUF4444 domain-containing protein [Paracoccaceae bacterium]